MQLFPWNNPLVGTAFMLRARRGTLLTSLSFYIIILIMAFLGWQYYVSINPDWKINPYKGFLRLLFGLQCFFSGILMMGQAGNALKNEVMNKTLDFQRIASTSPWDILLGKLLGVPVMSYLLAMAAIPIAVFALMNGVPGITLADLLLMWLQLLTFLFLLGACTIQNTLQVTSTKGTGSSTGLTFFLIMLGIVIYASYSTGDPSSYLADPRRSTLGALLTPLTAYAGIIVDDPWQARFYWFSFQLPCLLVSPIAHLIIAWFFLSIMARRLAQVDATPLGKSRSYLMLLLMDLLLAGVLNSCSRSLLVLGGAGIPLQLQCGVFLVLHGAFSILYFIALTPRQELVLSWIWRFRHRNDVMDSLLHDRAPATLSVIVNLLIGLLGMVLLINFNPEGFTDARFLPEASICVIVTILFLSALYQTLHLTSRKLGSVYFILVVFAFCLTPLILGGILRSAPMQDYKTVGTWLLHATPFTMLLRWVIPNPDQQLFDINPYPMACVYFVGSLLLIFYTWRRVHQHASRIQTVIQRLHASDTVPQPSSEVAA